MPPIHKVIFQSSQTSSEPCPCAPLTIYSETLVPLLGPLFLELIIFW
jgi:hypothetical protein